MKALMEKDDSEFEIKYKEEQVYGALKDGLNLQTLEFITKFNLSDKIWRKG